MKTAIVTGGSRGIGRAISLELASAGARIVLTCRQDMARAEATAEEIRKAGGEAIPIAVDVRRPDEVKALADRVSADCGGADILVNNAGVIKDSLFPFMAALAEFLAARGFLVASVPSPTRISGPMQSEADIPSKADEQASDLGFARQALRAQAREGRVGAVGHSFGARSALLLAMRDADVSAVVSLDGGIGARTGAGLLEKSRGFSRDRMHAALLHFYEELDPQMAPDFTLIRSLDRSDRWLVRVSGMHHIHFTTIGALIGASPGLFRATAATAETATARDLVLQGTESFLTQFVGPGPDRPARWQPPSGETLRVEALPASR